MAKCPFRKMTSINKNEFEETNSFDNFIDCIQGDCELWCKTAEMKAGMCSFKAIGMGTLLRPIILSKGPDK